MMGRLTPLFLTTICFLGHIPCPGAEPQLGPCWDLDLPGIVAQPGTFPLLFLVFFWLAAAACPALPAPPHQLQLNPQGPPCLSQTTGGL